MLQVSNSFRTFLYENRTQNRIAGFLDRALWYEQINYKAYRLMIRWDQVNYLTLRGDGTISFLPKGKPHVVNDDGRWGRENRQNGRPATVIRKVLTDKALTLFKASELEAFANRYKSACVEAEKTFVIKDNVDIPDVYCMRLEEGHGTLYDSCMNGDRDYLEMYRHVPGLRILCLLNTNGELAGRALLWKLGDDILMDRVYVVKDEYYDLFLDYASDNDFIRKVSYKSYRDKDQFTRKGEIFTKAYKVVCNTHFEYYPYIDTFSYGGDGYLTNECRGYDYEYCRTDGSRDGDQEMVTCGRTGDRIPIDNASYCEYGRYGGEYLREDIVVYVKDNGSYYWEHDDDIVYIDRCSAWYLKDGGNVAYVEDAGDWFHIDDVCYSDFHGESILEEDAVYSDHHNDYIKSCEAVVTPDGKIYHKSDIKDYE
jgi:hypothetical protein